MKLDRYLIEDSLTYLTQCDQIDFYWDDGVSPFIVTVRAVS